MRIIINQLLQDSLSRNKKTDTVLVKVKETGTLILLAEEKTVMNSLEERQYLSLL